MGGGIVLIFFGFLLMWATAIAPAYAILRRPLARLHFILRLLIAVPAAFILALVFACLIFHWRSKALLIWYFVITVIGSLVIPVVLLVLRLIRANDEVRPTPSQ